MQLIPTPRFARAHPFPDPRRADPEGLLAYGGDLSAERLLAAYETGIFPWYDRDPILWFSPDPRMVLVPSELHVGRSLAKSVRRGEFELRLDTAFARVIERCASVPRPGQDGTWINSDMIEAYVRLHEQGFAHSAEAWRDGELCGGLYGVSLGRAFFGESMFADESDASKVAFVRLVNQLAAWDFELVDCQVETEHLARFGATTVSSGVEERRTRWSGRSIGATSSTPGSPSNSVGCGASAYPVRRTISRSPCDRRKTARPSPSTTPITRSSSSAVLEGFMNTSILAGDSIQNGHRESTAAGVPHSLRFAGNPCVDAV